MATVFTGGGYVPPNTGQGAGSNTSSGTGNKTPEPSEEEKGKALSDLKDWVNNVFSNKNGSKPRSEADILNDRLGSEFLRTWPDLVANNWQLQQFLFINKQKYYNSPLLNAIAAYKYWEENKKHGLQGLNVVSTPTQWAVANLMNWLGNLYGLNYVYTLNLDDLAKKKNLPGNDMKKDERAPEPDKQNDGGAYTGGTKSNTWLWVLGGLLALGIVAALVYFTTSNKAAAAA